MNQLHRRRRQTAESCECLRPVIRMFGIVTSFVVCGVGVDVYLHSYKAGLFIFICSIMIFIFEIKWIITLFLHLLFANDSFSTCIQCWSCFKMFGGWRLSLPYIAIGAGLILWPHNLWLSCVAGVLLILLAVLRLCTLFRFSNSAKDEGLLPKCDFEKIENYTDVPDDIIPNLEDEEPIDDAC